MKRTHFKTPEFPCDPGLQCTYPNCPCNVKHVYSTDERKLTPMQMLGGFMIVLSCLIVVWFVFLIAGYWQEIIDTFQYGFSIVLMNKYAGGFTMLVILIVVYKLIWRYSKRGNF